MFLANPEPSFMWTFQDVANKTTTELKNGTDNFIIRNAFDRMNLSALSMGIRKHMHEDIYGTYIVTATNSQGSGRINFSVEAQGKPNPPYEGIAICPSADQAILSWKSAFDGGSTQTFVVGKRIRTQGIFVIDRQLDTPDPGQHRTAIISISGLTAGTQYFFVVFAVNKFGNSTFERDVNCTTQGTVFNIFFLFLSYHEMVPVPFLEGKTYLYKQDGTCSSRINVTHVIYD
ncbi:titin-like [Pecten maximus]|uniref:titin-like n=1 Tax=Pecten maximus TaxID=6579 RepID=UPI00145823DA|nr:titin-like [Pecten maximus]